MTKIAKLIQQFCPNGVEYKRLQDVCDVVRGVRITKSMLTEDGAYPVVSGGTGYMGRTNQYNRNENTITIAQYGTAGYVSWRDEKFWANDVCYAVTPYHHINNRFLYHCLLNLQQNIYALRTDAVPPCLPRERLLNITIPVPPLEVQEEVVRILDKFTTLEAELEAELSARRKQYEYYREQLLTFRLPASSQNAAEDALSALQTDRQTDRQR